jgi:hypothetical protein
MLDWLIDFGSLFDWITPLCALLSHNVGFTVPRQYQVWAKEILKAKGIRVHHEQLVGVYYTFTVKREQAKWAKYLLDRSGL